MLKNHYIRLHKLNSYFYPLFNKIIIMPEATKDQRKALKTTITNAISAALAKNKHLKDKKVQKAIDKAASEVVKKLHKAEDKEKSPVKKAAPKASAKKITKKPVSKAVKPASRAISKK
ncbi:MAG TPA: hypothetical protein VNB90_02935 [Cytophagaceae bacterium]|nr:hypothetical protein [Cytophagaceae bacterium]